MRTPPQIAIDATVATLTKAGFPASYYLTDNFGCEDDEIEIANPGKNWTLGMQIGDSYICLNRYTEEPFTMEILSEHANLITATEAALKELTA